MNVKEDMNVKALHESA